MLLQHTYLCVCVHCACVHTQKEDKHQSLKCAYLLPTPAVLSCAEAALLFGGQASSRACSLPQHIDNAKCSCSGLSVSSSFPLLKMQSSNRLDSILKTIHVHWCTTCAILPEILLFPAWQIEASPPTLLWV